MGGGYEAGVVGGSYTINCYDPVKNSWSSSIRTPYCFFAMTTLNNKLLIAGGEDKSYKKTNKILTLDGDQLKNYTKMTKARSDATAAGYQGMLIITGGIDDMRKNCHLLNYFIVPMDDGTLPVTCLSHTTGYNQ